MRLILHDAGEAITQGVYVYSVSGLPNGESAQIAAFNDAWRILRWNETWHGNWTGAYVSAEEALAALREEISMAIL